MLKTPTVTRWNSLYDSILNLLCIIEQHKTNFDSVLSFLKISAFSNDETNYLKSLCDSFEPIAFALDIIQGENDIYSGIAIPLVLKTLKVTNVNGQ